MENSNVNIKKSKKALLFLALLLMVVPFYFLFDLMAPILTNDYDYPTWVSVAFAFGTKLIGILIYIIVIVNTDEPKVDIPVALIASFLFLIYIIYNTSISGGLNDI